MFNIFKRKQKQKDNVIVENSPNTGNESEDYVIMLGNAQHQGQRDYQEDSFGFSDYIGEKGMIAVLADGMGGLSNGKEVSGFIVEEMLAWFNSVHTKCEDGTDLKNEIASINRKVSGKYFVDGKVTAGSTVTAVFIKQGILHWISVGDSRIYLKRNNRLLQVTEDHDFLNQLLTEAIESGRGVTSAFSDPQKDSLAGCIGKGDLDSFDYSKRGLTLLKGDVIMLCSDGVYNALSEEELSTNMDFEPMTAAENIKDEVLKKHFQNQDNLTVIIISVN